MSGSSGFLNISRLDWGPYGTMIDYTQEKTKSSCGRDGSKNEFERYTTKIKLSMTQNKIHVKPALSKLISLIPRSKKDTGILDGEELEYLLQC